VAGSERPGPEDPLAQDLQDRAHLGERVLVLPADHERQRARLGPGDTAGDRRVDHPDAGRREILGQGLGADRVR
jgi:hypothetical protein